MASSLDTQVITAPQNEPVFIGDTLVTPTDGTQGTLADKLAAGGLTITDGSHTVSGATQLTVSGATVGGSTPNATLTISGGAAPAGVSALIASAIGVNLNETGDTTMTLSSFATGSYFVVDFVLATNASISLDTAQADTWSGAGGTGQQYSNLSDGLNTLVNPRDWYTNSSTGGQVNATNGSNGSIGTMQNTAPIVNVSVPQGAPATADFYVFGRLFS